MKQIKMLIMDVDGTLTDGKIYLGNCGEEYKSFNIKEGYGIANILPLLDVVPVIITRRKSRIVEERCRELGIAKCHQNCRDKYKKLKEIADKYELTINRHDIYEEIAYVGDDEMDLGCMIHCGVSACPKDAVENVSKVCCYVSEKNGGDGVVRDVIEWLKKEQG